MKVLQFSGGLDSLACLELLKDVPHLVVVTASTDGAYPERAEYLDKVADHYRLLDFYRVETNRQIERFGHPVDVVPLKYNAIGSVVQDTPLKYQAYYECCSRGLWGPMVSFVEKLGATVIYRGQRKDDSMKAPIHDGLVIDGITYLMPIENWTRSEVKAFVQNRCPELIPAYYDVEKTSRDCWDCTAFLHENRERIANLSEEQRSKVIPILDGWKRDVTEETRW